MSLDLRPGALDFLQRPRCPDERVFGPPLPDGADLRPKPAHGYPFRICLAHPGVSWYGVRDCFVCRPEAGRG